MHKNLSLINHSGCHCYAKEGWRGKGGKMYSSELPNAFVQIAKCIQSKFSNVFDLLAIKIKKKPSYY